MTMPFYSLDVEDIIDTANFFMIKVKESISKDRDLNYYLYGFVVSTFSIPDYLLYQKFIDFFHPEKYIASRIDMMTVSYFVNEDRFCVETCKTGNVKALKFIQFCMREKEELMRDPSVIFLKKLRDHIVHRNLAIKPGKYLIEPNKGQTNFSFKGEQREIERASAKNGIAFCHYTFDKMWEFVTKINTFYRNECK